MKGELTKNHQTGDEDLNNVIVFKKPDDTTSTCNLGRFFQLYLELLHPEQDRLFQKAKSQNRSFSIHDFSKTVLFEKSPVGKHKIPKNMKTLCEILGKPPVTNHDIRATAITQLKKLGIDDRAICAASGMYMILLQFVEINLRKKNSYFLQVTRAL